MKNKITILAAVGAVGIGLIVASAAYAATPTFTASYTGNGDYVQINVNGDPNSSVVLNNQFQMQALGTTNSSGSFSVTLSTAQYNIAPGSVVSVTVNGQTSNSIQWPYTSTTGSFSLNQTSLSLVSGQSSVITASTAGPFFVSSNSNPSVANVGINGSQITVTANTTGNTNVSICLVSNTASCSTVSVIVNSSGSSSQSVYFSQNNITIPFGQSMTIAVSGGTGVYTIVNNSNSTSVSANISGSVLSLIASNVSGSSAITVCSSNMSSCGVVNVTVGSASSGSSLTLSQTNPVIGVGQSVTVSIIGGVVPYYVSSNSNSSVVSASITSNTMTLSAIATGSANVTICSSNGTACGTVYVTVNVSASGLTLNPANVTLTAVNQSATAQINGSGSFYVSSNSNPSAASAAISGANLIISANGAGTTNIGICSNSGQCGTFAATVSLGGSAAPSASSPVTFTEVISVGQTLSLLLSGGQPPYSLSPTSNAFAGMTLNSTILTLSGIAAGNTSINVCSANGACTPLSISVTAAISTASGTPSGNTTPSSGGTSYLFTTFISRGDKGATVTALQRKLTSLGFYSGPVTGYFGDLTFTAVKAFQSANNISPVGYVGPSTRSVLNSR